MSRLQLIISVFILGIASCALPFSIQLVLCTVFTGFILMKFPLNTRVILFLSLLTGATICRNHDVPETPPVNVACRRIIDAIIDAPPGYTRDRIQLKLTTRAISPCIRGKEETGMFPHAMTGYLSLQRNDDPLFFEGQHIRFVAHCQPRRRTATRFNQSSSPVYYTFQQVGANDIAITSAPANPLTIWLARHRKRITDIFETRLDPRGCAYAIALTTGQRAALSEDQKAAFRITGTAHLLAVSGLHLGILSLFTWYLLLFTLRRVPFICRRFNIHQLSSMVTVPVLILFTLFTGANPPVVRACIMALAVLLTRILHRQEHTVQALMLAAGLMLAHRPGLLVNAGFQLSFACVSAFLFFQRRHNAIPEARSHHRLHDLFPPVSKLPDRVIGTFHRIAPYFKNLFFISVIAFVATAPITAFHFQTISLSSPIANLLLVPLVSLIIMPVLILVLILSTGFPQSAALLVSVANRPLLLLDWLASKLAEWAPVLYVDTTSEQICTGAAALALFLFLRRRYRGGALLALACVAAIFVSELIHDLRPGPAVLTVDFFDTGQGDATLVTFPDRTHWLIDAGGTARKRIGKDHIVRILRGMNVSSLDKLILTHPDPDHVAGIPDILQQLQVREIWENGQGRDEPSPPAYHQMVSMASRMNIPIRRHSALCGRTQVAGVEVELLHPCNSTRLYYPEFSFNDNSMVLKFTYGKKSVLLPGDLSRAGENHLLSQGHRLRTDILKLGHHGSGSSSTADFLGRTQPGYAIASCGFYNQYQFPSDSVKKRLAQRRIRLFQTDIHGWIRAQISAGEISIATQKVLR